MSTGKSKARAKVDALKSSLDELESKLEPLFAKPLADTVNGLETLQQAKLYAALPYLINALVFVNLKTQGIDPKSHSVVGELDRVKQYFAKITNAEEAGKQRTTAIDKEAAGRFIKHAISQARQKASLSNDEPTDPQASTSSSRVVLSKVTEKMKAREEYLRNVANEPEDEDVELGVFDGEGGDNEEDEEKEVEEATQQLSTTKRKRPLMDPFVSMEFKSETPSEASSPKKKKKKRKGGDSNNASGASTPINEAPASSGLDTPTAISEKKTKKKKKKSTLNQG